MAPPSGVAPTPVVGGDDPTASRQRQRRQRLGIARARPACRPRCPLPHDPTPAARCRASRPAVTASAAYRYRRPRAPFGNGDRPTPSGPPSASELLATNNVFQTSQDQRSDIVAPICPPSKRRSPRRGCSGALRYSPTLRLYASYSSNNGVDQFGDERLLAAVVPGPVLCRHARIGQRAARPRSDRSRQRPVRCRAEIRCRPTPRR